MPSTIRPFTLFHEEWMVAGVREISSGKESLKKGLSNLMVLLFILIGYFTLFILAFILVLVY
jgi:hypothetical protein